MDCSIVNFSPEVLDICIVFLEFSENPILQDYGIIGLFFNALIGATILPIPTEPLVGTLLNGGENEYLLIAALVGGSSLGGLIDYGVGYGGSNLLRRFRPKKDDKDSKKSHKYLAKFGWAGIFFSAFIPVFGDLMLISAGAKKMEIKKFMLLMTGGNVLRAVIVVFGLGLIF